LLVLAHRLSELSLGLEQPLLERAHPLRSVLQAAEQRGHLVLERPDLRLERLPIGLAPIVLLILHSASSIDLEPNTGLRGTDVAGVADAPGPTTPTSTAVSTTDRRDPRPQEFPRGLPCKLPGVARMASPHPRA